MEEREREAVRFVSEFIQAEAAASLSKQRLACVGWQQTDPHYHFGNTSYRRTSQVQLADGL